MNQSNSSVISLQNLGVTDSKKPLLHSISLEIFSGDTVVFFGPSGGGKSTLLK